MGRENRDVPGSSVFLPGASWRPFQNISLESQSLNKPSSPQRRSGSLSQPHQPFGMSWRSCQGFCVDETCFPLVF